MSGNHDHGGHSHDLTFDGMSDHYKKMLWLVIGINASMFCVEIVAGWLAGSKALQADSLDFLGDTLTYALSLYVIGMPLAVRAKAAFLKGLSLAVMGVWVLGSTLYAAMNPQLPMAGAMGAIALLALAANVASVLFLMKYKDGDANVRSVWLCSRNDAIGNVAVVAAAFGVFGTGTAWPDLLVAIVMASLFCWSAQSILRQSFREMRKA